MTNMSKSKMNQKEQPNESDLALVPAPCYTKDDYLSTTAPYEFLYTFNKSPFLLAQMRDRLRAQAASVGVKSFVGLWNAYLETQALSQGVKTCSVTAFDGQPMELSSGRYICDFRGVYAADKYGYEECICPHPIMPIQRLVNIDNGNEKLKIAYQKGRTWRTIIADKTTIASSSSITQLASSGVVVTQSTSKDLATYLFDMEQMNYDDIPEQRSVGRLGWVGEHGFSPYVDGLAFDGEDNFRQAFNATRECGNYDVWLDAMRKVRAERAPGRMFLAASFASALIEPCGLLPFFFHAWGGTEVGKSVGLMIAASVWANPKIGEFITSFNSTSVGQEMMASFLNSLPMCIDELQIQNAQGVKDFDKIIYGLTEGVGRVRGAKEGGLRKVATWRNVFITNGEQPISNPNSGGGAINRIIEFECQQKTYSDLVWLCSVITKNYGFAGKIFVDYLQTEQGMERAKFLQQNYFKQLQALNGMDKQAASISAMLAADAIATELIFQDGANLTVMDFANLMLSKASVSVNARATAYLYDAIGANDNRFKHSDNDEVIMGEIWGKIDEENNKICLIKATFDKIMSAGGFNGEAWLSFAKRSGLLLKNSHGRYSTTARISSTPVRCICIPVDYDTKPEEGDEEEGL